MLCKGIREWMDVALLGTGVPGTTSGWKGLWQQLVSS